MKRNLTMVMAIMMSGAVWAKQPARGLLGQQAPEWGVTQWLNLPADKNRLDIADFKGKVVYLYGFQALCSGCHKHGFPTLKEVIATFGDDPDVAIVAVQTAFEGYHANDIDAAKRTVKRYALNIPVGQSGHDGNPSPLMRRYRSGGTPWTVIIDRNGIIRFNDFHIDADAARHLIGTLKAETGASSTP
jgi:hypothetical protein